MGLGVSPPPALLRALADRATAGAVADLRLYYMLSTGIAGDTVLRPDLRDRIRPVCLFHSMIERALDARAAADGLPPVEIIPTTFSQVPRILCEQVGVDTLLISPIRIFAKCLSAPPMRKACAR
jgi:itaconate CoA-transferase